MLYSYIIVIDDVQDCTSIAKPLYQLTEHNKPFKWTDQCQDSFVILCRGLVSAPILAFPNFSQMFMLDTDASNQGIRGGLSQEHDNGLEHVVAYASQALSKTERK